MIRKRQKNAIENIPDIGQLQEELKRERYKQRYAYVVRSTVGTIAVVAAVVILIATMWMPVLKIYGISMSPTLTEGQIVVTLKGSEFDEGDIVAFYVGNKLLVKRIIAGPGDVVSIDDYGTVYVNYRELQETYVSNKTLGKCDIEMPYVVPESQYFIMGDNRQASVDSRSSSIGSVSEDQIVGRVILSIWPLSKIGSFR